MKYVVQIQYTNPAHEHISLRRRVESVTRIVEAKSEEEAINRATNQQRALGFMIKEAAVVTVEQKKPLPPVINESKKEEMDDNDGQEDDDEMDDEEEDDDEEDDLKEGIAADMFAAKRQKAQKLVADKLKAKELAANKEKAGYKYGKDLRAAKVAAKKLGEDVEIEYIEEKLTAADPASKWISDFVASDNPKFAGKSKKERISMALGAHYAAKRAAKNEEVEQTDEAVSFGRSGGVIHYNPKTEKSEKDGTAKLYDPETEKMQKKLAAGKMSPSEVMSKMKKEETMRVVNKKVKGEKEEKSAKAAETMINLAKSKKNKVNAKPTLDLSGAEKRNVTKV
jgi:hypothetical protein